MSPKAAEVVAETKTARLPQFNAYILGGESLTPIDFTIPSGALGVYPATGPIPAQIRPSARRKISTD